MFSEKTFNFLVENRIRNSKEWFKEHRPEYLDAVMTPLMELVSALGPTLSSIDPLLITEPKTDKTISRIYCDMRFSRDHLLYREEMWLSFRRDKKAYPNYPEFFFVISPNEFLYGCGYYCASADSMECLRKLILEGDSLFARALDAYEGQNTFELDGELYKRSKYPEQPERIRNWLDRKSICVIRRSTDFNLLYSEKLPQTVGRQFKTIAPVYDLFTAAESRKKH